MQISRVQLEENNHVCCGHSYVDVNAAMAIQGQTLKKDLKELPFVVYLSLVPTMRDIGYIAIACSPVKLRTVKFGPATHVSAC
jgi:hypothetical protein